MAILTGAWQRALDDDNVIVPTAKLRIYDAGTTNLASNVYSDAALSSACANPLPVADASGWFPLIFAPSGATYDVRMEQSDGTLIREFVDQEAIGSDAAAVWERNFTNSRGRIAGVAGQVSFEGGPAVGDDIGGSVRLGGYEDTQADDAEIDAAITRITGDLTVRGKSISSVVLEEAVAFSGASNVDIALTELVNGVRAYRLRVYDFTASAGTSIWFRLSYDNALTFKSGGTDYGYSNLYNTTTTPTSAASAGDSKVNVGNVLNGSKAGYLELVIMTVEAGTNPTIISGTLVSYDTVGSAPSVMQIAGYGLGGYGRASHLRLTNAGGATYSGKYTLEALLGYGE